MIPHDARMNEHGAIPLSRFALVMRVMKSQWNQISTDHQCHIARGVLSTRLGKAYIATFSVDDVKNRVQLALRLPLKDGPVTAQFNLLSRLHSHSTGLCSAALDLEQRSLRIHSCSVLPGADTAAIVVPEILRDTCLLLEDEALQSLAD